MRFSRICTLILASIFIIVSVSPATAQDCAPEFNWGEIDFQDSDRMELVERTESYVIFKQDGIPGRNRRYIAYRPQFPTGLPDMRKPEDKRELPAKIERAMKASKDSLGSIIGRSHAATVWGNNDCQKNRQSSTPPVTAAGEPESNLTADAELAQSRADVIAGALGDIVYSTGFVPGKINPEGNVLSDSVQALPAEKLSDLQQLFVRRSAVIVADEYARPARDNSELRARFESQQKQINAVAADIDSIGREHQRTRKLAVANRDSLRSVRKTANRALEVAEESGSGTKFGGFVGVGGQYFAGETTGLVEGGLRAGNFELFGSYNARPNIGMIDLPKLGETQIGRSGYRVGATWYPIESDWYEIGPQAAFEHGENYLKDREEFVTVFESTQLGLAANVQLWKGLHGHVSAGYAVTNTAETSDLSLKRLKRNDSWLPARIRGGVSLRWRFRH